MNGIFSFSRPSIPYGPGTETIESGGGAATPVAEDFSRFLQSLFSGGTAFSGGPPRPARKEGGFGADIFNIGVEGLADKGAFGERTPVDQTTDIMQALNALIAGPDVSGQQSAIQQIIQTDTERQASNLRERFTAGGGSRGTPSAVAEGLFRSEVTPRIAAATGELELRANQQRSQALFQLMQILLGFSGRGIPQARTDVVVQPGPLEYLSGFAQAGGSAAAAAAGGG